MTYALSNNIHLPYDLLSSNLWFIESDIGLIAQVRGLHGLNFELFTSGELSRTVDIIKGGNPSKRRNRAAAPAQAGATAPKDLNGAYINFNQKLRTVFSESSLCYARVWDQGNGAHAKSKSDSSRKRRNSH
jgi:hypothetical protein